MVVGGSTGTVDWCDEPERQTRLFPCPPRGGACQDPLGGKGVVGMEVMHARCAGLDVSKKDAKVCVRVAGAGRRKAVETVTTWSSMTSRVLALREHFGRRAGHVCGDGSDQRLLEAVL